MRVFHEENENEYIHQLLTVNFSQRIDIWREKRKNTNIIHKQLMIYEMKNVMFFFCLSPFSLNSIRLNEEEEKLLMCIMENVSSMISKYKWTVKCSKFFSLSYQYR